MKTWKFGLTVAVMVALVVFSVSVLWQDVTRRGRAESEGWHLVGHTPRGAEIRKKYFQDQGVWIFVAETRWESISAVPMEFLEHYWEIRKK